MALNNMNLLLFDMDGVLLQPRGYHLALQRTVDIMSRMMGFGEYLLSDEAIVQFEALGISSEWHSSALCTALWMTAIAQETGKFPEELSLEQPLSPRKRPTPELSILFESLAQSPDEIPALTRAEKSIEKIALQFDVDPQKPMAIISNCESIVHSLTFNIFQELVIGSENYRKTYGKLGQLSQSSYLKRYDQTQISSKEINQLKNWLENPEHGAAIMTNRPSSPLFGAVRTPEAEIGARLVGLDWLPITGRGEIQWLADQQAVDSAALLKPVPIHALVAALASVGLPMEKSLQGAFRALRYQDVSDIQVLANSTIYVFEDTPGGLISAQSMQDELNRLDISINLKKIGIAATTAKKITLRNYGARVFASPREAFSTLGLF